MSQADTTDTTKRIPKSLATEPTLIGTYSLRDLLVAIAPGAVVILLARTVLPPIELAGTSLKALSIPVAAVAIAGGVLFVSLTPRYTDSLSWLTALVEFHTDAPDADHTEAASYTQVKRVHPELDAIERADGALVGAIQVDPKPMALATDAEWRHTARGFTDFLNTTVEFPIQLYATTRSFPVDDYLAPYEQRRTDPDVQDNPTLQRLIDGYVDWYRADLERREPTIRDHYVIVSVRPESVRHTDDGIAEQLASVPIVGVFVDAVTASRAADERAAMASALDDRLRTVERGVRELDGCAARRVSAADLTDLVADYWTPVDTDVRDTSTALRTTPLVAGPE